MGSCAVPSGDGWLGVIWTPSPNFGVRRDGAIPRYIVLHYTAMPCAQGALRALSDPAREVSAHFLIGRCGASWQLVECAQRAWHAGAGRWGEISDMNSASIGIELDNDGVSPFSAPLMTTLETLLVELMRAYAIAPHRVIAHSDLAPGRKIDPGRRFDWARLARQGLAVVPPVTIDPRPVAVELMTPLLAQIGYTSPVSPEVLLDSFRLRARPWQRGGATRADLAAAQWWAARYPVDADQRIA